METKKSIKESFAGTVKNFVDSSKWDIAAIINENLENVVFSCVDERFKILLQNKIFSLVEVRVSEFVDKELNRSISDMYLSMQKEINKGLEAKMKSEIKKIFSKRDLAKL